VRETESRTRERARRSNLPPSRLTSVPGVLSQVLPWSLTRSVPSCWPNRDPAASPSRP